MISSLTSSQSPASKSVIIIQLCATRTSQRPRTISSSLRSFHGLLKAANFLLVVCSRKLLGLKIVLSCRPPFPVDCYRVPAKVGEAAILSSSFIKLDHLRILWLRLERCAPIGIGGEIRVVVRLFQSHCRRGAQTVGPVLWLRQAQRYTMNPWSEKFSRSDQSKI